MTVHLTIGSFPRGEPTVLHDVEMSKTAILYADRVALCSPNSALLSEMVKIRNRSYEDQLDQLVALGPVFHWPAEMVDGLRQARVLLPMMNARRLPKELRKMTSEVHRAWQLVEDKVNEIAESAGFGGIERAMDAGLLEICPMDVTNDLAGQYFETILRTVTNATTYPMFDQESSDIVRLAIKEGRITPSELNQVRSRHVGLAAHLVERLPLFEGATMDEILDIRSELERPLLRFRSAMVNFSEKVKTASWDKDFPQEAELVFIRSVEPAVLEIEEALHSNNYLARFVRKFVDRPQPLTGGSMLTLALSQLDFLPKMAVIAAGGFFSAGIAAFDTYLEWRQKQQGAQQNYLFFYYQMKTRLGAR